jgi:hypothetical protein
MTLLVCNVANSNGARGYRLLHDGVAGQSTVQKEEGRNSKGREQRTGENRIEKGRSAECRRDGEVK